MIGEIFEKNGLPLTREQIEKMKAFSRYLLEGNEKCNLTAITDEREIAVKHLLDSALGLRYLPQRGEVADVGSGAGFPSLPLMILCEDRTDLRFTLIDSLQKRVAFLNETIAKLGLTNGEAIHARAEEEAKRRREWYDFATARAVAPLNVLSEYVLPLVKQGGTFVAYKASGAEDEVAQAKKAFDALGGALRSVDCVNLNDEYERRFVVVDKVRPTPGRYPRGQNKPRIMPL